MRGCLTITYIIFLILTIIFAMVELGLASDLLWEINRSFFGLTGPVRARTRYLIFCSTWGILAGIVLLMLMTLAKFMMAMVTQIIVMFISMVLWLLAASLFTSVIGGSGINCGPTFTNCHNVNIVNSTMAFAWINWSFIMIAFGLASALAIFGSPEEKEPTQMRGANPTPASNATAPGTAAPLQTA